MLHNLVLALTEIVKFADNPGFEEVYRLHPTGLSSVMVGRILLTAAARGPKVLATKLHDILTVTIVDLSNFVKAIITAFQGLIPASMLKHSSIIEGEEAPEGALEDAMREVPNEKRQALALLQAHLRFVMAKSPLWKSKGSGSLATSFDMLFRHEDVKSGTSQGDAGKWVSRLKLKGVRYIAWLIDEEAPSYAQLWGVHAEHVKGSLRPLTCQDCAKFLCDATGYAEKLKDMRVAFKETCSYRACDTKCIAWPTCRGLPSGCSQPVRRRMMRPLADQISAAKDKKKSRSHSGRQESKARPARETVLPYLLLPLCFGMTAPEWLRRR